MLNITVYLDQFYPNKLTSRGMEKIQNTKTSAETMVQPTSGFFVDNLVLEKGLKPNAPID